MKNTSINIPLLNDEYGVIVCWGDPAFLRRIGKRYQHREDIHLADHLRGACWNCDGCKPIIVLRGKPKTAQEIATLAHEAVHAVSVVFKQIYQFEAAEEVFAHSVGAIVRKVLSA